MSPRDRSCSSCGLKKGVALAEVYGHTTGLFPHAIAIADMRVGQTERVMAKLKVGGGDAQQVSELLEVTVRYRDAIANKDLASSVKLTATFTDDAQQIATNLDEEVRNNGIRAEGARQMTVAAQAIREGKREDALGIFDNLRATVRALDRGALRRGGGAQRRESRTPGR